MLRLGPKTMVLLSSLLASVLSGCMPVPTYQRIGSEGSHGYGYHDEVAGEGNHLIRVVLPPHSDPQLAFAFWDKRAAEVCAPGAYRKNIYAASRPLIEMQGYTAQPGEFILEGLAYCNTAPSASTVPAPVAD